MNFFELVFRRYSCRRFNKDRPCEREKLKRCVEAARLAPSACNSQPWRFLIIDEPELKNKVAEVAIRGIYGVLNRFLPSAPCIVVVLADRERFIARAGGFVMRTDYFLIDIGIACEHFVLQAQELGLRTCYIGYFNERGLRKLLKIPRNYKIVLLIAVGYPADEKDEDMKKKRKPIDEIMFFNRLDKKRFP